MKQADGKKTDAGALADSELEEVSGGKRPRLFNTFYCISDTCSFSCSRVVASRYNFVCPKCGGDLKPKQ